LRIEDLERPLEDRCRDPAACSTRGGIVSTGK
jgi:hypothetical protein